ncbi:MAG: NAD(+)/NADH kinase [Chloroflexota bacterium]|nr:MAG: NAD(+)/NADH kinase [Chloroflexota bacterium]
MTRFGFAFNPTSEAALVARERALAWSAAHDVAAWAAESGDTEALTAELRAGTDILVVLGGDGTFLRAARAVAAVDVPILGVNSGKVGFLSRAEGEQLEACLGLVLEGAFELEPRMVLQAQVGPAAAGRAPGPAQVALNEAAIVRGSQARVVRLDVAIDSSHLATYTADGLIVATPTGSTGYAFSAGGPILDPTSRNLVVVPVAAYLAGIRSVVVGPHHTVTVRVESAHDVLLSIDGHDDRPLAVGDQVRIRAHERPIHFVRPDGAADFWDLLRQKVELLPS